MSFSILGKIVLPDKVFDGTIVVENEKIKEVIPGFSEPTLSTLDYRSSYILPGLIEVHGHLREPGLTQKENIEHGTRAALAGGVTTIIDMPNSIPPTVTQVLLQDKVLLYSKKAYTDFSFFFGASSDSLEELEKIPTDNIVGIKLFMAGHETTPTTIPDDETLEKVFQVAAKRNLLVAVHAEDQNLVNYYTDKYKDETDPSVWSKARPKEVVIKAVERAIRIAKKYNIRLYLLHLSTPEEFELIRLAKNDGLEIYGELVSYQLTFNANDYEKLGNKIKVAPALRSREVSEELWSLFRNKVPDVLCSEHTPHEWETKNQPNVWKAQSGMPNIQESLPAVITKWIEHFGKESLEECLKTIAQLNSSSPARIFGFTSKGSLETGMDADMVIIDPSQTWTVKKEDLFTKCGWSAYEGMTLIGRPQATFLRGIKVYENGKIIGEKSGLQIKK